MTTSTQKVYQPQEIDAVSLKHPWRWVTAGILAFLVCCFVYNAAKNEAYGWDTYVKYLFDTRILTAAGHTLLLTVLAMTLGVLLGSSLAVLRMSSNPVLQGVSWIFLWLFRGTPIYVQLVFWGLLGAIYQSITIGSWSISLDGILSNVFLLAVIGLGLNESAYMAEIVRAGIQSVPAGQSEASKALGMSWRQNMTRTILPQAMRIIVPPTGNELISMLKTTSLVVAIPYSLELYGRSMDIANSLFEPVPLLLVAASWYLFITSILMYVQHYVEKYFSKGATTKLTARQMAALADAEAILPSNTALSSQTLTEEK